MRLGTIRYLVEYVVDLDNAEMVENAKDAMFDYVQSYDVYENITELVTGDERAEDIPSFLTEDVEEEEG
jgi:hypothetical protein